MPGTPTAQMALNTGLLPVRSGHTPFSSVLIPINEKEKPGDLEFSIVLESGAAAAACFARAANQLRSPSQWHLLAGWSGANFQLTDDNGIELRRLAVEGDYLRIDVPRPGAIAGNNYNWLRIENIDDGITIKGVWEWIAIKLCPCPEPGKGTPDTAHFFREEAGATLVLDRAGTKVTIRYHGCNEVPGFSTTQWDALIKGLLTE